MPTYAGGAAPMGGSGAGNGGLPAMDMSAMSMTPEQLQRLTPEQQAAMMQRMMMMQQQMMMMMGMTQQS